jgi:hypothetical protein
MQVLLEQVRVISLKEEERRRDKEEVGRTNRWERKKLSGPWLKLYRSCPIPGVNSGKRMDWFQFC